MALAEYQGAIPVQGAAFDKVTRHLPPLQALKENLKIGPVLRMDQLQTLDATELHIAPCPPKHRISLVIPHETSARRVPLHHGKRRVIHVVGEPLDEIVDSPIVSADRCNIPHGGDQSRLTRRKLVANGADVQDFRLAFEFKLRLTIHPPWLRKGIPGDFRPKQGETLRKPDFMTCFANELICPMARKVIDTRIRVEKPCISVHANNDVRHLLGKDTELQFGA